MNLTADRQCTARAKSTGVQCTRPAVLGGKVCYQHGGAAKQVRAAGQRRVAAERIRALGYVPDAPNVDPAEALLELVSHKAREVAWLRATVDALAHPDGPDEDPVLEHLVWELVKHETGVGPMGPMDSQVRETRRTVYVSWLHDAEDQLARYATAALKAGVEERRVRIHEAQAGVFVSAIRRLLDGLNLTHDQRAASGPLVAQIFRELTPGDTP